MIGERDVGLAEQVCEQLSTNLLNDGRTLYEDNFYTNYNLAHKFLQKKTHVVGTVRSGRKKLAKEMHVANLKRREVIAKKDQNGIAFLKWKDKRDVRMLSTKHTPELCAIPRTFRRGRRQAEEQRGIEQESPHNGEERGNEEQEEQKAAGERR